VIHYKNGNFRHGFPWVAKRQTQLPRPNLDALTTTGEDSMTKTLAQYRKQFALKQEAARSLKGRKITGKLEHDAECAVTSLVSDWDYMKEHLGKDRYSTYAVDIIERRIASLIQTVGISRYGKVNEVTDYHPIRHQVVKSTLEPPSKVSIVQPGLLVERADGTQRVLLPAIAKIVV